MVKSMKFYEPKTISVSLTGKNCGLNCKYCQGHYLQHMVSAKELKVEEDASYLISGGFDRAGRLPLYENRDLLRNLCQKAKLNVHPGFLKDEDLELLKEIDPVVSFDFIQDPKVIREVINLPYGPEDYVNQYKIMEDAGLKVVPHMLLGLGEKDSETLQALAELQPEKAVVLVFRPTRGTSLAGKELPSLRELGAILDDFRKAYQGELILGCMRPGGTYRIELDNLAADLGFDGIVKPVKHVKDLLKDAEIFDECCAF